MKDQSMEKDGRLARILTLILCAFIGVGALEGSICMLIDPVNPMQMGPMLPYFQKMPFADVLFQNFTFAGISLLIVNGLTNLTAFVLILRHKPLGNTLGWVFGITLMLWIAIQFWLFVPGIYAIDVVFFLLGLAQFACGYLNDTRARQAAFRAAHAADTYVAAPDASSAVVYFSRHGYVRALATDKARQTGSALIPLKTPERTAGNLGFWWCGRFGMHRWEMPLEDDGVDYSRYVHLYLFTPVWVFRICAPVRGFLKRWCKRLPATEVTIVHFMRGDCRFVFAEITRLLGHPAAAEHSVSCRRGKMKIRF